MDEEQLLRYCLRFFGYGQPNALWAYIGMEEWGCREIGEAIARLNAWHALGEPMPAVNLLEFHNQLYPVVGPIAAVGPNQTWEFLIRIRLAAEGEEPTPEAIHEYPNNQLGNENGSNSLLEFMPLPCPSIRAWPWPKWCNVEATKTAYVRRLAPTRILGLQNIVNQQHNPRVVIFYGKSYHNCWLQIVGLEQMEDIPGFEGRAQWAQRDGKLFVSTWHPGGIRRIPKDVDAFARGLGEWIGEHLPAD